MKAKEAALKLIEQAVGELTVNVDIECIEVSTPKGQIQEYRPGGKSFIISGFLPDDKF